MQWLSDLWGWVKGLFSGDINVQNTSKKRIVKAKKNSIAIGGNVTGSTVENGTGENE